MADQAVLKYLSIDTTFDPCYLSLDSTFNVVLSSNVIQYNPESKFLLYLLLVK